jgi:stage II sporulation protein D
VARNQTYRGVIEATAETGTFGLINQLDVEDYLKGMGEVLDPAWPPAALGAQAIAARTYALRAMSAGGELCDDQRCQVYLGAQAEYGAMDQAVDATRAQVLVAGTTLAATVYSANGGAFSASRQEGFGTDDDASYPYLRAAPYPTGNPLPWETRVALADVATRLGYPGRLDSVSVTQRGPSGRALSVTLNGPGGPALVSGLDFAAALGLRSTLFTLAEAADPTAPPPPQSGTFLQVSPDQVPALAEAASSGAAPAVVATERQGWAPPEWSWAAPAAMPRPVRGRSGLSIEFVVLALVLLAGVSTRLAAALRHH